MGFWDGVGNLAGSVIKKYGDMTDEAEVLKEKYESYGDERLLELAAHGYPIAQQVAARMILHERGYRFKS